MATGAHVESIAVPHQQSYAEGPFPLVLRQSSGHRPVRNRASFSNVQCREVLERFSMAKDASAVRDRPITGGRGKEKLLAKDVK